MKAQYEQLTTADSKGEAEFRRISDGCTAYLKVAYFKPSPLGGGMIPGSGAKRIKIEQLTDWVPAEG